MNVLKGKTKKEKMRLGILAGVIGVFVVVAILADFLFPNTVIGRIINNSVGKFFNIAGFLRNHYVTILESIALIFFMWIITQLLKFVLLVLSKKGTRSETVMNLMISIVRYGAVIVTVFLILSAWGVQTPTLLAGAGILGLALSFGAQSLIEDVLAGLFLIFEKQFQIGDVIQIEDFRGTVIEIGIRTTKFEDINGDIKTINNSDIRSAINTSSHLSPAICDISISYGENLEKVEKVIVNHLSNMKEAIPDIEEGPFYRGVQSLGESSVVIRIYAKCNEAKKYQVVRDLNREMKLLFDKNKIQIPFPQLVIHQETNVKKEKAEPKELV